MIIAMPMSRDRLAAHFTKAQFIAFYNDNQQLVAKFDNPALAGECSDKKAMLALIVSQGADIVIVNNIGQRMLGKLLDRGICVSKGMPSLSLDKQLLLSMQSNRRLLDASEGRPSLKHDAKGGCGGGCSGHDHDHEGGGCCSSEGHDHDGAEASDKQGKCCAGKTSCDNPKRQQKRQQHHANHRSHNHGQQDSGQVKPPAVSEDAPMLKYSAFTKSE